MKKKKILLGDYHAPQFYIEVPAQHIVTDTKDAFSMIASIFSDLDPSAIRDALLLVEDWPCLVEFQTANVDVQFVYPNRAHALQFYDDILSVCNEVGLK